MCYGVLGGISPGYPPVTARLHTCYSPVRRSPADEGKPSSPLPLDLHVLSLSLAFILSQDQTLRCCILLFYFFFCFRKTLFTQLSVFPAGFVSTLIGSRIDRVHFCSLVLLLMSIVNLSMFSSFLFACGRCPKADAKLMPFFIPRKYLAAF